MTFIAHSYRQYLRLLQSAFQNSHPYINVVVNPMHKQCEYSLKEGMLKQNDQCMKNNGLHLALK